MFKKYEIILKEADIEVHKYLFIVNDPFSYFIGTTDIL